MSMRILFILSFVLIGLFTAVDSLSAGVLPAAATTDLPSVSIDVGTPQGGNVFDASRDFVMRILKGAKVVVSGFALIYIVLLGATMIIFSENEEKIKSQRRQMSYILIAFLFLNIPGTLYIIFFGDVMGSSTPKDQLGDVTDVKFWDEVTFLGNGFLPSIISFFEIFIFGIAILTLTW